MIMAPVSSSQSTSQATADAPEPTDSNIPFRKRASIHYPEGSSAAKRMSLHFGPRARSHSESWAFTPTSAIVPELKGRDGSSMMKMMTSAASTTLSPLESEPATAGSAGRAKEEQVPDPELLKTLASFLRGHQDETMAERSSSPSSKHRRANKATERDMMDSSDEGEAAAQEHDLVIRVRDFAYPKTHPYHVGDYPPEPEYEGSDEEDDSDEDSEEEEEGEFEEEAEETTEEDDTLENEEDHRTEGQARGLYDFDAENSSELSFREGDIVWIHCRQFPGWFLGEMGGVTGLVPENYVQFV
ncbi:Rho GTPase activating protein 10 [Podila humilis]|nr:Rho GTPase activating protein 10 [Podila humilis]